MLIHQEEAHHQFGLRVLSTMVERGEESHGTMRDRTQEYLPLAKTLLFSVQDAFYAIDEDPQEYWDDFSQNLPTWLHSKSAQPHQSLSLSISGM